MTDKDTGATVASEAVRAIRGMNALLKDYTGTALAHLYELQESETIRLIVGAQPLIPPTPDGLLKFKTSSIKISTCQCLFWCVRPVLLLFLVS